jgi:hypothetical protein
VYADFSKIVDQGHGFSFGLSGELESIVNWKFELSANSAHYISHYFNSIYLVYRELKYMLLESITERYGGWLLRLWKGFNLTGKKKEDLTLSLWVIDSFSEHFKPMLSFDARLDRSALFNRIGLEFTYTKTEIDGLADAFAIKGENSFATFRVGYTFLNFFTVSLVLTRTFVRDEDGDLVSRAATMLQANFEF